MDDALGWGRESRTREIAAASPDEDLEAAAREVDLTLLRWFRALPLTERLDWASKAARLRGRLRG